VDRANSLFMQMAVGAAIAAQHGALRAAAVLRSLRSDGMEPPQCAAIRTLAILTVLSLHLGACFCAVAIFQGMSHSNAAKVPPAWSHCTIVWFILGGDSWAGWERRRVRVGGVEAGG